MSNGLVRETAQDRSPAADHCQMKGVGTASIRRARRCQGDEGAVLVEFAILTPLLFLIIFGIIEFGWAFYQDLDVRHGSRETARLVAVNYKQAPADSGTTQTNEIIAAACDRMDAKTNVSVTLARSGAAIGDSATITVSKPLDQLTGYLGFALNNTTLSSTVKIRLEQAATWAVVSNQACP